MVKVAVASVDSGREVAMVDPATAVGVSDGVTIGTIGTTVSFELVDPTMLDTAGVVLSSEALEVVSGYAVADTGAVVDTGRSVTVELSVADGDKLPVAVKEACEAEMEASTEDCEESSDDKIEASDESREDTAVVTGTGIAVTPSEPDEVLRVYNGEVVSDAPTGTTVGPDEPRMVVEEASLAVKETGTGTTVGPAEPRMVVDETALGAVETGTGMTVGPSEPRMVLELMETAAVPVLVALAAVSVPAEVESDAVGVGSTLERSVARDDAAADRMLEN